MIRTSIEKMNKTKDQYADGVTLLEVLIAISIISIVLVSVYRLHSQTLMMNYSARFHTVAPFLAQEKLTELDLKEGDELDDGSGDFGDDHPGYKWTVSVTTIEPDEETNFPGSLKMIELRIDLNEGQFQYDLKTYRFVDEDQRR